MVKAVVVQYVEKRLAGGLDFCVVKDPTKVRIDGTRHVDLHPKRMTVQAFALMALRHVGKPVCGLERDYFVELHSTYGRRRDESRSQD